MDIDAYLDRIGLDAPPPLTADGLDRVHRAQAARIPYEGLDIQLNRPLDLNMGRIFDKLVRQGRGGWCYETNGLLGWALGTLGFSVRRCTAGVRRKERGDAALGNHLTLIVTLEHEWLCDLGLGDGLRGPIALRVGRHRDGALEFGLERLHDGYWRFHNHAHGAPDTFDFTTDPADEGLLQRQNDALQCDPDSHFVLNAEAVRMWDTGAITLLGRVLRRQDQHGLTKALITGPDHMDRVLALEFGITGVDCAALWPRIVARHAALFGHPDAAT